MAAESRRVRADLMRVGLAVCDRKALLLQISGDALEADFVAAWLGRCLQEKCPQNGFDKKKRKKEKRQSHENDAIPELHNSSSSSLKSLS